MIITARHVFSIPGYSKKPGFCIRGLRLWCRRHNINLKDFVRNGVDSEKVLAIGDAMGIAVVRWAEQCEADNGQ